MSWQTKKKTENDNADDATVRLSDNVSAHSTNERKIEWPEHSRNNMSTFKILAPL